MATIKIDNDQLENRGDAQTFLREVAQQIGLGYTTGPGWEFEDSAREEEEAPPETTGQPVALDVNEEPLAVGDYVFAEDGAEDVSGAFASVHGTILSIEADPDGGEPIIRLEGDGVDLSMYSYEPRELEKKEKAAPPAEEVQTPPRKRLPWEKPHEQKDA